MANDQITQVPVEVLVDPTDSKAQITQAPVEVLVDQGTLVRVTQEPVEVLATPASKVRTTQEPVDVLVAPDTAKVRTTQFPVEVLVARAVTLQVTAADITTNASANLVIGLITTAAGIDTALIAPLLSHLFGVAVAESGVAGQDVILVTSQPIPAAEINAVGVAPGLSYSFAVSAAQVTVEGGNVTLPGSTHLLFETAIVSVAMSDVGLSFGEISEPTPGVGPQIVADRDEELFGLLTLRVESMRVRVEGGEMRIRFYQAIKPKLRNLWKSKPRPVPYAVSLVPQITFKVEPFNHLIFRVHPQPFVNFSVECTQVLFEERTSALWGELQVPGYLEEAKVLQSLFSKSSPIPSPSKIMRIRKR